MALPGSINPLPVPTGRVLLGIAIGSVAGLGIAGTMLVASLGKVVANSALLVQGLAFFRLSAESGAFMLGNALFGSAALAWSLRLRALGWGRIAGVTAAYAAVSAGVLAYSLSTAAAGWGLCLANVVNTSLYHAQFFTLGYTLGRKIGGVQAGSLAAGLVGVGGFVVFSLLKTLPAVPTYMYPFIYIAALAGWLLAARMLLRWRPDWHDHVLQAVVILCCLTLIVPWVILAPASSRVPVIVHFGGFAVLGVFLLLSEYVRMRLRDQTASGPSLAVHWDLSRIFFHASNLLAPLSAICILFSGWKLIHSLGHSLTEPWLFCVALPFFALQWHGALVWTKVAGNLVKQGAGGTVRARLPALEDFFMTVHGIFFLFIFYCAITRQPARLPGVVTDTVRGIENLFPADWQHAGAAVTIWAAIGVVTGLWRWLQPPRRGPVDNPGGA